MILPPKNNQIELRYLKNYLILHYEMRAIFTESLVHETLFNTAVYESNETRIIMHNFKT